jgi:hypothetical protein
MKIKYLVLSSIIFAPNLLKAYSCEYVDPKEIIPKNKFVFIATVKSSGNKSATLEVKQNYKSPVGKEIEIGYPKANALGELKPSFFKNGESYLIATDTEPIKSETTTPQFILRMCGVHLNVKDSPDIIKWLNSKDFQRPSKDK